MLSARPQQDENRSSAKHFADPENPQIMAKMPLGGKLGPKSARKAMGNITNQAFGSIVPAAGAQRKALGDITNSTPGGGKAGLVRKPLGEISHNTPLGRAFANPTIKERPKEDAWAEEGIEMQAGKGWRALEAEQEALEMQAIKARVQAALRKTPATSPKLSHRPPSFLQRRNVATVPRPHSRTSTPPPSPRGSFDIDMDLSDLSEDDSPPCPTLYCME